MRVLVCGGRDYADRQHIWSTLSRLDAERGPFSCIIHGAATGADSEAKNWARAWGRKDAPFKPDWNNIDHPKARIRFRRDGTPYDANAGFRRNQEMLDEGKPDLVIAFPGGPGTADMVHRARRAGHEPLLIGDAISELIG